AARAPCRHAAGADAPPPPAALAAGFPLGAIFGFMGLFWRGAGGAARRFRVARRCGLPHEAGMTDGTSSERIAKRLARAGVASRRGAEAMIAAGRVAVNGRVIDSPALNVTAGDRISVDGAPLPEAEAARLWRYHKPAGLVTTARDEKGRATVFERLPPELPRVMSVGRLDINSEGLLLLTNDGALKRRLELPSTG